METFTYNVGGARWSFLVSYLIYVLIGKIQKILRNKKYSYSLKINSTFPFFPKEVYSKIFQNIKVIL